MNGGTWLVLGGAGLVGVQVARRLLRDVAPARVVIASLRESEVAPVLAALRSEFQGAAIDGAWGDLFLPSDLADTPRAALMASVAHRRRLLDALYGDIDSAARDNRLCTLIASTRPNGVIDCVNTATGLSYQDVFDGAQRLRDHLGRGWSDAASVDAEALLLSQSVPQIVRHVTLLDRALRAAGTSVYVKVGTTGTGGMGLNIPYTHGEDRPSRVLMAKTEAGFGHTGLLFLMARTPGGPVVKEIKPGAMIGYKRIAVSPVSRKGKPIRLTSPRPLPLGAALELDEDPTTWPDRGPLEVAVVDTGENGVFSHGEFAAITALGQMEFVTPEEIAGLVVREATGHATGREMVAALDASVLGPSYKAGLLRDQALRDLAETERTAGRPSIALGQLGPPELSKLLFEAWLLKTAVGDLKAQAAMDPTAVSGALADLATSTDIASLAVSIGVPLLMPDGESLLRGPRINVPELKGLDRRVEAPSRAQWDTWAVKGWIDLRASNVDRWKARAGAMVSAGLRTAGSGSHALDHGRVPAVDPAIGDIVAWVLANEMNGHRVEG